MFLFSFEYLNWSIVADVISANHDCHNFLYQPKYHKLSWRYLGPWKILSGGHTSWLVDSVTSVTQPCKYSLLSEIWKNICQSVFSLTIQHQTKPKVKNLFPTRSALATGNGFCFLLFLCFHARLEHLSFVTGHLFFWILNSKFSFHLFPMFANIHEETNSGNYLSKHIYSKTHFSLNVSIGSIFLKIFKER